MSRTPGAALGAATAALAGWTLLVGLQPRFVPAGPAWVDEAPDLGEGWVAATHGSGRAERGPQGQVHLTTGDCARDCRVVVSRPLPAPGWTGWVQVLAEVRAFPYDGPRRPGAVVLSGRDAAGHRIWLATSGVADGEWRTHQVAAEVALEPAAPLRIGAVLAGPGRELEVREVAVRPVRRKRAWDGVAAATVAGWFALAAFVGRSLLRFAGRAHTAGLAAVVAMLLVGMQVPEVAVRALGHLVADASGTAAGPEGMNPWWPWLATKIGGHAALFAVLGAWSALLLPRLRDLGPPLALLAIASEALQSLNLTRTPSARDVLVDLAGAATGVLAVRLVAVGRDWRTRGP